MPDLSGPRCQSFAGGSSHSILVADRGNCPPNENPGRCPALFCGRLRKMILLPVRPEAGSTVKLAVHPRYPAKAMGK
jgi:hypothetical protein